MDDCFFVYRDKCGRTRLHLPSGEEIKDFYSCHVDETSQEPKKIVLTVWGFELANRKAFKRIMKAKKQSK